MSTTNPVTPDLHSFVNPTPVITEPPFDEQTVSLNIAGTDKLAHNGDVDIGIADAWTVAMWINLDGPIANMVVFESRSLVLGSTVDNRIMIALQTTFAHSWNVQVRDPAGATILEVQIKDADVTFGTWYYMVTTWDGTDLAFYKDGVAQTLTINTDNRPGSQTSTLRGIWIGSQAHAAGPGSPAKGDYHWGAILDKALSADAVLETYNSGSGAFNLAVDGVDYDGAANNKHWWRLGHDDTDIGKDSGIGTAIDVMNDNIGITAADIVVDVP